MEKIIKFIPAYDKRHQDPDKNYGIHGVMLYFYLKGDKGAVQFALSTNWQLPHVQEENDRRVDSKFPHLMCHPSPWDLGVHSLEPQYEGQTQLTDSCEVLDDKPCYYDGSTLNAEPVYERLLKEGHEGVWKALEEFYNAEFVKEIT